MAHWQPRRIGIIYVACGSCLRHPAKTTNRPLQCGMSLLAFLSSLFLLPFGHFPLTDSYSSNRFSYEVTLASVVTQLFRCYRIPGIDSSVTLSSPGAPEIRHICVVLVP
ncbi:hypothetical protein OG21DRAFT_321192 [Imleria badia]|nr:hypothetical protein OG21DRAFT_321192 [Imleria badia]